MTGSIDPAGNPPEDPTVSRFSRPGRLTLAAWAAVLGGIVWLGVIRPRLAEPRVPSGGHWEAVARGRALLEQGRPDLALAAVSHIRDEASGAGEAMCVAGIALGKMDRFGPAKLALERAIRLQPRQPMATKVLAALHLSMGDSERGLECLRKAAELAPKDFRPWFTMGQVYLDLGEPAKAAEAYLEALRRNPAAIAARIGRIEALLGANGLETAGSLIGDTLPSARDNAKLLGLAARQARETGRNEEALAFADRSLELDPNEPEALMARARIHAASGRPAEARRDLERVVANHPNRIDALTLLTQVASQLGLRDLADQTAKQRKAASDRLILMDAMTQEISARPNDPEPRYRMGLAAIEGRQWVLARNCFNAALAVDPEHEASRRGLRRLAESSESDSAGKSALAIDGGLPDEP
ncbi:MAG: tetratricopeptide repeat protein [Isosphaeraceae bacterium]|nr:tetratricopeptide repeat protein [Isosphaeraceae bacterium]